MKKVIKQWLAFTLAIGAFVSCSEDRNEPSSTAEGGGETVTLSLSAEVSMDDTDLRAINYKLGTNANGAVVPLPQFTDGELVDVHTIVKSSYGEYDVKTLKWRYNATKRLLELAPSVKDSRGTEYLNELEIQDFNNDDDRKWYISGLIGGDLPDGSTQVEFQGFRVLKGVDGNPGDAIGSLSVPYAFGWTELELNTKGEKDQNNSYASAKMPATANAKFQPMGALIGYRVGNAQAVNASFDPEGFNVGSNTWGDRGIFDLNTNIPSANPNKALPVWKERLCGSSIYYTFVDKPSQVAHGGLTEKIYYAWVMPHATQPAVPEVNVMLKGKSSRQPSTDYQNYTDAWFTDYTLKSAGKLDNGKVYTLSAKATRHLNLPVQYVTEYNLKGGGQMATKPRGQAATEQGPIDFATSHKNDASGYYSFYKLNGFYHSSYNPNTHDVSKLISEKWGDAYVVPRIEQLWGIFPSSMYSLDWNNMVSSTGFSMGSIRPRSYDLEPVAVGSKDNLRRNVYSSEYSGLYTANDDTDNAVVYAIRFKAREAKCDLVNISTDYDPITKTYLTNYYPSARDNSMKCAYRFTRVAGTRDLAWQKEGLPENLDNRFVIDVVYLGEEAKPTTLANISDERWWNDKKTQGRVFTRTFSFPGMVRNYGTSEGEVHARSQWGYYWSSNRKNQAFYGYNASVSSGAYGGGNYDASYSLAVRLFHKDPIAR